MEQDTIAQYIAATFEAVKPLLAEAHARAVRTRQGRAADRSGASSFPGRA